MFCNELRYSAQVSQSAIIVKRRKRTLEKMEALPKVSSVKSVRRSHQRQLLRIALVAKHLANVRIENDPADVKNAIQPRAIARRTGRFLADAMAASISMTICCERCAHAHRRVHKLAGRGPYPENRRKRDLASKWWDFAKMRPLDSQARMLQLMRIGLVSWRFRFCATTRAMPLSPTSI
jgi:hypothetical protein